MPLPQQIRRLMTQTVSWEALASKDGYGDETYKPAVQLRCHVEAAGMSGGDEMRRPPDESRQVPTLNLLFDGGDERVQSFTLNDRFTIARAGGGLPLQPTVIDTVYGPPPGDAWLVRVTVG